MGRFDALVLGGQAVLPGRGLVRADVGIREGRISAVGEGFASGDADETIDAAGKLAREWRKVRVKGHAAEVLEAAKQL